MNTDKCITAKPSLDIKSIHSVYLSKTKDWKRDFFAPRKYDGIVLFLEGEIEYNFGFGKFCAKMGDILAFPGNLPYSGVKISDASVSFIVAISNKSYRSQCKVYRLKATVNHLHVIVSVLSPYIVNFSGNNQV